MSLCDLPTPLVRMERLGKAIGHDNLWIKRDDLTSPLYGGNKIRKLDFIFAEAARRRIKAVATAGACGSHHVLATSLHGRNLGLDVGAVLYEVPQSRHLDENQGFIDKNVSWKIVLKSPLLVPYGYGLWIKKCLDRGYRRKDLMIIPPGGSSALGCLGYVNAALEIEDQREKLGAPPFDHVFTALGTCGTYSGLELGFRLASAPTSVTGVQVAASLVSNSAVAWWVMFRTLRILKANGCVGVPGKPAPCLQFPANISGRYLGRGYATWGREEEEVAALLRDTEGIKLDTIYTAKAMRAFIDHAGRRGEKHKKLLFVLTYGSGRKTVTGG